MIDGTLKTWVLWPIMNKNSEVKVKFSEISLSRIYRNFSGQADKLSKEAFFVQEGLLSEQEFKEESLFQNLFNLYIEIQHVKLC